MNKKVLVLYFSQSGQMREIVESLCSGMAADIHYEELKPKKPFPFPWTSAQFFNAMPETFLEEPIELHSSHLSPLTSQHFDLIIIGYPVWFLTPCPAISSFLQSETGKQLLNGKNVLTITGCRNMWLNAQEKVKRRLNAANANLVGHVALVDKSPNLASVLTILRWMLTGKRDAFWFLPPAGVQPADVARAKTFGEIASRALHENNFVDLQQQLNKAGAIEVNAPLVLLEKRGQRAFTVWSRFIKNGGPIGSFGRNFRVRLYMTLLIIVIFLLSPIVTISSFIQLRLNKAALEKEAAYYKGELNSSTT